MVQIDREIVEKEPVTVSLPDGSPVTGLLCTSSSRPGYFWVEYNGRRKTDARSYREPTWTKGPDGDPVRADQSVYMRSIARIILREMTESDVGTTPIEETE